LYETLSRDYKGEKMKTTRVILSSLLAFLMLLSLMPIVYAAAPDSSAPTGIPAPSNSVDVTVLPGTATVDGDPSEWDYNPSDPIDNANYVVSMYTGWDSDKPALADLYMRYECDNQIMYAFVRTRSDLAVDQSMTNTWIAEGAISNKITFITFAWIYNDNGTAVGWEASFSLAPESLILVHTMVQGATAGTAQWLNVQPSCPPPSAVGLVSFAAQGTARNIVLSWETASEIDNLGFNLYRADSEKGPWTQLNEELIPGQAPGSPVGGTYAFTDSNVRRGVTYYYRLQDVSLGGSSAFHGPVSAKVQALALDLLRPRLKPVPADTTR
jgi:hypothetical protein